MYTRNRFCAMLVMALWPVAAAAQIPVTTIVNPGFEIGTPGTAVSTGWTQVGGLGPMFIATSGGPGDLAQAHSGSNYLTANRQVPEPDYPTSQNMGVMQDVDLTPYAGAINLGGRQLDVSFAYNDNDPNDTAVVFYSFLDGVGSPIGSTYTFTAGSAGTGAWAIGSLAGEIPVGASSMRLSLTATYNGVGTVRNISYDTIGANILPPAPPAPPSDLVNGNLIQFNSDGVWSWYMDERLVHDPANGHFLINSITSSGSSGVPGGTVRVTSFDPVTGTRRTTSLSDIDEDDHNAGALLVLPNGKYLTMYSNHGSPYSGDNFTRWRVTTNPHDISSWVPERTFNWNTTPGWNQNPFANSGVSYHNIYYLSDEDRVYNFSRGTQMAMNLLTYDADSNDVTWMGQLQRSQTVNYGQGYFKFASNGVDRIYFIGTETHPYDVNTSIFAGYTAGGMTYAMDGTLLDSNLFDNLQSAPGATVPYTEDFTLVQQADPVGNGYNYLWTADLALNSDGTLSALYTSKFNGNDNDQRLHYARWDGANWQAHEVAKMGSFLFLGQEEYTGVGAVVRDQPNVVYISTPINPATDVATPNHEIYKGVTNNGGADWTWTAVTSNSNVDNLRPIAEPGSDGATLVSWFRGTYTNIQNVDAAVVGIIDRPNEQVGPVDYLDATAANTMYASGAALQTSTPSGNTGPLDNLWHQRTGVGNGGSVLTSSESGFENAPLLKTTIDGSELEDGTYDLFAYFWSDNDEDWRLMAGLESNNLIDFRRFGSQHAETGQFATIETVAANNNDLLLYRAYLGRTEVVGGTDVEVFIDDWQSSGVGAIRTWYDGVGYALVSPIETRLPGDYNDDRVVDAADYTVWRDKLGTNFNLSGNGDETGDSVGLVDMADYVLWQANFGNTATQQGGRAFATVPEPAAAGLLWLASALVCLSPSLRSVGRRRDGSGVARPIRPVILRVDG